MSRPSLALVAMPWADPDRPSIQVALLQALLARAGLTSRTFHLYLEFARQLGPHTYVALQQARGRIGGGWLFARDLFPGELPELPGLPGPAGPHRSPEVSSAPWPDGALLRQAEDQVATFLERCANLLLESLAPGRLLIGFTCTYNQLLPSLALARRLKLHAPECLIVLGGAEVAGDAGLAILDGFPQIDWVVDGEADRVVAPCCQALLAGEPPPVPYRPVGVDRGVIQPGPALRIRDLDELPIPSYREYLEAHPEELTRVIQTPVELSRGCRWAESQDRPRASGSPAAPPGRCIFCSMCGQDPTHRAKSPARVAGELTELGRTTWLLDFCATDTLLHPRSVPGLQLLQNKMDIRLFVELRPRASTRLVARLARLGVEQLQPGIESFSSRLLGLLHKGTTLLDNLACLTACATHGLEASYNLLYGIPGETPEDYEPVLELLPRLHHLPPPCHLVRLLLLRGSPLVEDPARFGIRGLVPLPSWQALFPPGRVELAPLAPLFTGQYPSAAGHPVIDRLEAALHAWHAAAQAGARLLLRQGPDFLKVIDARQPAAPRLMLLTGEAARLLRICHRPRRRPSLARELGLTGAQLDEQLDWLAEQGLLITEQDRVLTLPLPWNSPALRLPSAPLRRIDPYG